MESASAHALCALCVVVRFSICKRKKRKKDDWRRATTTTTTTTTRADIYFFDSLPKGEEPPDTGGGRVFSLDATSGLLATRRRLGLGGARRGAGRGDSSAPCL